MQNNYPTRTQVGPSTESTTTAITPLETSGGQPKSNNARTLVSQYLRLTKGEKSPLEILLKTTLPNFCRSMLLGLLNWASPERRSLNASPSQLVPVYDIVNAGPRHRFSTARVVAHNCLGLGYGCGGGRFQEFAGGFGIDYTLVEAEAAVAKFRATNPKIVKLWNRLGAEFVRCGTMGETMEIELPTGRTLRYYNIKKETWVTSEGERKTGWRATTERGNKIREPFWGSKLTENLVQALARDVFAQAVLRIWNAGIRVLWTVHDELICEVPENTVDESIKLIEQEMTLPHPEMPELPLAVDAHVAEYYDK